VPLNLPLARGNFIVAGQLRLAPVGTIAAKNVIDDVSILSSIERRKGGVMVFRTKRYLATSIASPGMDTDVDAGQTSCHNILHDHRRRLYRPRCVGARCPDRRMMDFAY
jgi:hypothetical protein